LRIAPQPDATAKGAPGCLYAPGALAKGCLGNEAQNHGELIFSKNFYLPGAFSLQDTRDNGAPISPITRFQVRIAEPGRAGAMATECSPIQPHTSGLACFRNRFGVRLSG
jgi:hypothetical protein